MVLKFQRAFLREIVFLFFFFFLALGYPHRLVFRLIDLIRRFRRSSRCGDGRWAYARANDDDKHHIHSPPYAHCNITARIMLFARLHFNSSSSVGFATPAGRGLLARTRSEQIITNCDHNDYYYYHPNRSRAGVVGVFLPNKKSSAGELVRPRRARSSERAVSPRGLGSRINDVKYCGRSN